jgi:YbgC/YbaW family acyl-CoA thioester hydrolase
LSVAERRTAMLRFRYRVGWADVDAAKVIHYPRCFYWIDDAFHGYLYERGFTLTSFTAAGYGLPFVHVECRYLRPVFLEDELMLEVSVQDLKPHGVRRCVKRGVPGSAEIPPDLYRLLQEIAALPSG